ncbi:MAG: 50S ribosomal protein L18e [Thermoplasmata archaeon]
MKKEGKKKETSKKTVAEETSPTSEIYFKRSKKTNPVILRTIAHLYKISNESKAPIWKEVANMLRTPSRRKTEVNLDRIARVVNKNETIIVPGKVLGTGSIDVPVTVAAFSFSASARSKILSAKGRDLSVLELANENPKGSGIRIIG